ncbi:MAG: phytanoyl-CoA dioxygenase [Paenibacillus sp.]|nr:phytanoyl-CoA dioxygenase [Paenibacillus sp.]
MRLSLEQMIEFQTNGVLIAEDVLTDADLQPVIDEINALIDGRAKQLFSEGKITELHENEPFERRYALLHRQCKEIGEKLDIMEYRGEAMFQFLNNDNLLDIAECLLGSELSCNPIQHLRHKLPVLPEGAQIGFNGNVPWHQDVAVTHPDSDPSEIITFWLPLVDATVETGCMEILPGEFRKGYLRHLSEGGTTIDPVLLPEWEPRKAECRKGGIVIMNKYTPHRSTDNISDRIRWSLDLRYHKTGAHSGRESQPSFAVRTRNSGQKLIDHAEWSRLWEEALANPSTNKFHRV